MRQLLQMIRFSHTVFALPFALLAAVMAWTTPAAGSNSPPAFHWQELLGIVLCMVFARSAAMAFNRLADRRLDAMNPRTAGRHLPAGVLSARSVIVFTALTAVGFVASTTIFLPNPLPLMLSVPVLGFLLAYSFTKRFTSAAHFWLGAALMLAPICSWLAIRGETVLTEPRDLLPAVWLGFGVLLWVSGFDIIYACQDVDFDARSRLHSIPAALGVPGALRLAAACHAAMILMLATLPLVHWIGAPRLALGWIYETGVATVAALLVYEHGLVRPHDLTRVNIAFFNVNAVVSLGLFAVTAVDLLLGS